MLYRTHFRVGSLPTQPDGDGRPPVPRNSLRCCGAGLDELWATRITIHLSFIEYTRSILRMRPPKTTQSDVRHPLNEILGTRANVRLLRVLALHRGPFAAGELAKRAMLTRTSVYPALRLLEGAGIVEFIGVGPQKLVQLRERHPLSQPIRDVFGAEVGRFDNLLEALRRLPAVRHPGVVSAWIVEAPPGSESAVLTLHVVARAEDLDDVVSGLNTEVAEVERTFDVAVAVVGLSRSEVGSVTPASSVNEDAVHLVAGVPPASLLEGNRRTPRSRLSTHEEHDSRARRLAVAIAAKLKADPGLAAIAADRVTRRAEEASAGERQELAEWARLLSTLSTARLRAFLVEDSERATRLRQSLPALQLLSPAERDAVLRSESDADVLTAVGQRR